jgi:hypothetical protein
MIRYREILRLHSQGISFSCLSFPLYLILYGIGQKHKLFYRLKTVSSLSICVVKKTNHLLRKKLKIREALQLFRY